MVEFVCVECGYRFEADKKKRCPYCGETNIEKDKSAEELIENVKVE